MFKDFLPVLKIIFRFIAIYLILLFSYQLYLNYFDQLAIDPFSKWVASQVRFCSNIVGYETHLTDDLTYHTTWFLVNGKYVSRMVEGCNAISIMILFLAFIFVFYEGLKTFIFALGGLIIIQIMNIFRIVLINIILTEYPEYEEIAHQYLFPAIIYGTIVILWLIWMKYFVLKKLKTISK